ncbi:MAG: hypothetical protein FWH21_07260, partial [Kiritimatiellaeota bacterium]|nr:hypothetical protein [Kiritimatiellota bacterium]
PSTWHLTGYAHCRLPGLYYAGKGDDNTIFSGNGRFKFRVEGERILVEDSLTQKLLQSFRVDKPSIITGISTTREGDVLTVFVNEKSIAKCFAVNLVSGNVKETLGAEKVPQTVEDIAFSRDGRWGFVIENNRGLNELVIITDANSGSHKEIALVPFGTLHSPISRLTLLEEERHLVIRSDDDFWLLDLSVARNYASQLDRMAAADYAQAHPEEEDKETEKELEEDDYYGMWLASFKPTPPIAPIALHAEQLVQHQAWFYAIARFNTCMRYAAMDYRAPRINPLLYARASFLAGQPALGKAICRNVLEQVLLSDRTDYNRMIRYHLQALYFAEEQ